VRHAGDVALLRSEFAKRRAEEIGVVVKVETAEAFERLPQVLLELLATRRCGVMVARGDLAVELGFERPAEVQEEILWLCQAAHVPVIWATEVLARLAKKGIPSRAEVTDAAMGERAEALALRKLSVAGEPFLSQARGGR
jgi:pyruvate kinase